MILKKPYAFLIKHFRIIHLLLLIPMVYLIIKTKAMVSFFSNYIANEYSLSFNSVLSNISSEYLNIFMYFAVLLILIVFIIISILLQKKEKPTKFYNIGIIYYIILFILITISFRVFNGIETDTIDDIAIRLVRDVSFIIHYSEYIFLIFTFIRGIGFNIKKFNFKNDIQELEISSEDSEEFEFLVGKDAYQTKRTIRRFFRELKYYYLENKFIFLVIFVIILGIIGTMIFMNREVYQKVYNQNETLSFGYLNIKVKNTYISSLSKNGKEISPDKTYVIARVGITNRYREDREFNYNNLRLMVNKKAISPTITLGSYFSDFGNPYSGTLIKGLTDQDYILVYEIDKYLVNSKLRLSAYSHYDATPGGLGAVNKEISINPLKINNNITTSKINKGTSINLSETNLKKTVASITDYEIKNRHEYQICKEENQCLTNSYYIDYAKDYNKTLLVLDYVLEKDNESIYFTNKKDFISFFNDFLEIKYIYNNKEYKTSISLLNTESYQEKLVMKVPSNISYASNIEAIITVRNVSYIIKLK